MPIFLDDTDYRRFLLVFRDVLEDFDIECWNYCLMPNHYHVTIRPLGTNLSAAIRQLNGVYGTWWNKRHSRVGHVFQGRFKAQIVAKDSYLLALSRYVPLNPVRAGLVTSVDGWPWSSYRAMAGLTSRPGFLKPAGTYSLFGEGTEACLQKRFAAFITNSTDDTEEFDDIRSAREMLGSDQGQTGVRPGSDQGQTRVKPGSDQGLTPV